MADEANLINKNGFDVTFVCGYRNVGEALRMIAEGEVMMRTNGDAGKRNIVEVMRHARAVQNDSWRLVCISKAELFVVAKELRVPHDLVRDVADCR